MENVTYDGASAGVARIVGEAGIDNIIATRRHHAEPSHETLNIRCALATQS
jgi:hypothetical protein